MKLHDINPMSLIWGYPKESFYEYTKGKSFFVSEMRPSFAGLSICQHLNKANTAIYITDNMLGILFYKKKIKDILFFYKNKKDNLYTGICGSLFINVLAKTHNIEIKFYEGLKNESEEYKKISTDFPFINYYIESCDESFIGDD